MYQSMHAGAYAKGNDAPIQGIGQAGCAHIKLTHAIKD